MANKREFKKYADALGSSACEQMVYIYETTDNVDKDKVAKAIEKVLCAVAAAKSNSDVTFDKGVKAFANLVEYSKAKKDFYRKLFDKINDNFHAQIDEALKLFNEAVPEEVKKDNKEAANK